MGEEENKKPEEPKEEEEKREEPKEEVVKEKEGEKEEKKEEGGEEKKDDPPPPPPVEIIMRVYMHCEGCARKVQRSLKGFEGVEEVSTDCRTHKVVVKGEVAAADPLKVVERVQKKTGRKVELLTPIPPKPEKKEEKKEEEKPKPEEKKDEPVVLAVVLKVHMHCEACSLEIKKRILKMKGVQSVEPELKASEVTVKGVFNPPKLVQYIYKRTGKHAVVIKQDPEKKPDEKPSDEPSDKDSGEKKDSGEDTAKKDGEADKPKEGDGGEGENDGKDNGVSDETMAAAAAAEKIVELKKNEFQYYYPRYPVEYAYPPQIFSDENPNACTIM